MNTMADARRAVVERWKERCFSRASSGEELLSLAVRALGDEDGDEEAASLRRTGASQLVAGQLLAGAARKLGLFQGAGYVDAVAWALAELDPFVRAGFVTVVSYSGQVGAQRDAASRLLCCIFLDRRREGNRRFE